MPADSIPTQLAAVVPFEPGSARAPCTDKSSNTLSNITRTSTLITMLLMARLALIPTPPRKQSARSLGTVRACGNAESPVEGPARLGCSNGEDAVSRDRVFDQFGRSCEGRVLVFEVLFCHRTGGATRPSYVETSALSNNVTHRFTDVSEADTVERVRNRGLD